jgi:hypothetical protein
LRLLYRRDDVPAKVLCPLLHRDCYEEAPRNAGHPHPRRRFRKPQARNLISFDLDQRDEPVRFLIRDDDSKYTSSFDEVFRSQGAQVIKTPIRAPTANAFAERVVQDGPVGDT